MDVLVLGSGAREHALAWRLARDEGVRLVRTAPGNGGTLAVGENVDLDPADPRAVARHAARERYDLVVIGPEAPLAAGVADELAGTRIPAFGPTRAAARLESSKAFAKRQMERAGVATAAGVTITDPDAAAAHLRSFDRPPVVKADWLAAGKGVVVPETNEDAEAAVRELFAGARAGARVVLEERLEGIEVSAFALVSDTTVVPLAAARDYKRLGDGDTGPNTGGMGAFAPVPWFGRRRARAHGGRGLRADRMADGARRDPVSRRAVRRPDAHRRRPDGPRVQRPLRRPRGPGPPARCSTASSPRHCSAPPSATAR